MIGSPLHVQITYGMLPPTFQLTKNESRHAALWNRVYLERLPGCN